MDPHQEAVRDQRHCRPSPPPPGRTPPAPSEINRERTAALIVDAWLNEAVILRSGPAAEQPRRSA